MAKKESPMEHLRGFLPEGSFEEVLQFLHNYKVHLTITRARQTILGDYRNGHGNRHHRISVNGNLNPYAFLITLLHELGHLLAYEKYGNGIAPHGDRWKKEFGMLLSRFLSREIFPGDIQQELLRSLKSPAASSCAEEGLLRILRKYDPHKPGFFLVEELPLNSLFRLKGDRIYCRGQKVRKRYLCRETASGKMFLFSPVAEVQLVGEWKESPGG